MLGTLAQIILATFIVSALALLGIFTLSMKEKLLKRILFALVSLSAGAMLGGAFLHLIPEALEISPAGSLRPFIFIIIGFTIFFLVEKVLHWHHCHSPHHHKKNSKHQSFAYMNLFGDAIHNFIDGLIIAASFVADVNLGVATPIAVALHEIPQEISDFGVLLYGGFKKGKALFLNFITALAAVLGGILGFFLSSNIQSGLTILLPLAAGSLIYIAASDLLPELRKEEDTARSLISFGIFILGIGLMFTLSYLG